MTTAVYSPSGELIQRQVGAADIVALLTAAQSAWGWIGGLHGVKSMFDGARNLLGISRAQTAPFAIVKLPPATYNLLTSRGLHSFQDESGTEAFGGDLDMQLVGVTVCALAHECGGEAAIKLFMQCLAPTLFGDEFGRIPGLKEAIQLQLLDKMDVILNEGALRGLTQRFLAASEGLPVGDKVWLKRHLRLEDNPETYPNELSLVGGMLLWAIGKENKPYYTRSGMVARISSYLREVGYPLDPARLWDGKSLLPPATRAVVLVTGGCWETDSLQLNRWEHAVTRRITYYQEATVGAMLVNSVGYLTEMLPETAQVTFLTIRNKLKEGIAFEWRAGTDSIELLARPKAVGKVVATTATPSPLATSLASIYFPRSARIVAPCYQSIALESLRNRVIDEKDADANYQEISHELLEFRVATAAIVFSLGGGIAGLGYWSMTHATAIDLGSSVWLDSVTAAIDKALSASLPLQNAAVLLASIHTAHEPGNISNITKQSRTVGSRNGIHAVLPALLTHMVPGPECVGLTCVDRFIANVPIHPNGWMEAANAPWVEFSSFVPPAQVSPDGGEMGVALPVLGPPVVASPDINIYVSIERAHHYSRPDVILVGRVNGETIGSVSILDTMWQVARSLRATANCPGNCSARFTVLNMRASNWAGAEGCPTIHPDFPVCLQVAGDPHWRLFGAGQVHQAGGMLMFGCFACCIKAIEEEGAQDHKGGKGSVIVCG